VLLTPDTPLKVVFETESKFSDFKKSKRYIFGDESYDDCEGNSNFDRKAKARIEGIPLPKFKKIQPAYSRSKNNVSADIRRSERISERNPISFAKKIFCSSDDFSDSD